MTTLWKQTFVLIRLKKQKNVELTVIFLELKSHLILKCKVYIYICTWKSKITTLVCTNITNMLEAEVTTGVNTSFNFPPTDAICHYLQTLFTNPKVSKREKVINILS